MHFTALVLVSDIEAHAATLQINVVTIRRFSTLPRVAQEPRPDHPASAPAESKRRGRDGAGVADRPKKRYRERQKDGPQHHQVCRDYSTPKVCTRTDDVALE
jgi:hypothetical protein